MEFSRKVVTMLADRMAADEYNNTPSIDYKSKPSWVWLGEAEEKINAMTNVEFLELISQAMEEPNEHSAG